MIDRVELQADDVAVGAVLVHGRREPEAGDAAERELILGSVEVQLNGVRLLRQHRGPRFATPLEAVVNQLLVVPEELPFRGVAQQFAEFFEHFAIPSNLFARREAFAGEVPFLAQHLPRHDVLGIDRRFVGELLETADRLLDELPKRRRVDLVPGVNL